MAFHLNIKRWSNCFFGISLTKNSAVHFGNSLGSFLWWTETDEAKSFWSASSLLWFTIFTFSDSFAGFLNLNSFGNRSVFHYLSTNRFLVIEVCDNLGRCNWAKSLECFSERFVSDWVIQILDVQIHTYSVIRNQSSCLLCNSHNQLFIV